MAHYGNGNKMQAQKTDAAMIINANLCNITLKLFLIGFAKARKIFLISKILWKMH